MTIVACPHCGWGLILPEPRLGMTFTCLNCNIAYDTGTARVLKRSASSTGSQSGQKMASSTGSQQEHRTTSTAEPQTVEKSTKPKTTLTTMHSCSNCHCALGPIAQRRKTLECPECHRSTSVYAILHLCPGCGAILESPRASQGQSCRCPGCFEGITVPMDVLFHDEHDKPDYEWYRFHCPNCSANHTAKQTVAGKPVVCSSCLCSFEAPMTGEAVLPPRTLPVEEPGEALAPHGYRHCPHCGKQIPQFTKTCRDCGHSS